MGQIFVQGSARKSFDGMLLLAQDLATLGTVYAFADESVSFIQDNNNSYPETLDNQAIIVNKVPGLALGTLTISGVLQPDRGFWSFINAAFGPRTNAQLAPWLMNIVPWGGASAIGATGIWFKTCTLTGRFGVSGADAMIRFRLEAIVADPNNFFSAPTLSAPAGSGTAGAGISSFANATFTDGQASPTTYDGIRAFTVTLDNRLVIQPALKVPAQRICSGCTPGQIMGGVALTQLKGAVQSIPLAQGVYPVQIGLPTGDGTHTMKYDVSASFDRQIGPLSPQDFATNQAAFTMFSKSAGATTTAGWPFVASYA